MALDEVIISRAIIERFFQKLTAHLDTDIAVVGGGPSGLVAGYFLAKAGRKVSLYERKLSIGGGMLLSGEKVAKEILKRL
jgi:sulfide-dependent adenosine diphosphate thiazole synthase